MDEVRPRDVKNIGSDISRPIKTFTANGKMYQCTPRDTILQYLIIEELGNDQVSVDIGTSSGGHEIEQAYTVSALGYQVVPIAPIISKTPITVYITVANWGIGKLRVTVVNFKP